MRLVVRDLALARSGRTVVAGIEFALAPGEALVVTGRNGAGKSTLLAALAGLLPPASGTVGVEGVGERDLPECVHLVAHRDGLKGALTAAENLAFARDLLGGRGVPPGAALAALGLARAAALPVGDLSAGQRRRVALARLLVAPRPLWLLDEPTSALDIAAQAVLLGLMRDHLAGGGLLVVATHAPLDLPGARTLAIGAPT